MNDTTSLYVESLLLEIQLDESNELITVMKKRWPHLNEIEPPSGAELAEAKAEPKLNKIITENPKAFGTHPKNDHN